MYYKVKHPNSRVNPVMGEPMADYTNHVDLAIKFFNFRSKIFHVLNSLFSFKLHL